MPDYPPEQADDVDDEDDFTTIGDAAPFVVPHFGSGQYTPGSPCPHPKAGYKRGEPFYCVRCDISGRDHYAYFRRALKAKKPEPKQGRAAEHAAYVAPATPLAAETKSKETRRERRARMHARGLSTDHTPMPDLPRTA